MRGRPKRLTLMCRRCKEIQQPFDVGMDDLTDHSNGALVQDVFSYLNANQRELIISGTCDQCWRALWLGPNCNEEDEYEDYDSL